MEPRVVKVPVLDTGIGREAGFENDAALIAHAEAERAKLPASVRAALDEADAKLEHAFLFGAGA